MTEKQKILFSGIQPSGTLHIGNYIGAISQWLSLQENYNCIFCVVDYHAITVKQDPEVLRKNIIETAKVYLACGIDPKKAIIFQQSDLPEHTELAWIFNCVSARISDLGKMTQFKDKSGEKESASVGLFDYPALMAADILLYNTEVVPVGEDQKQHVELTRTLAKRFNKRFGETFVVPELKFRKEGARIMGLDNPEKKMSKSAESEFNYISLTDNPEKAAKKIMKATTDSGSEVKHDPENKAGVSNLLTIYSLFANKSIKELEKEYKDKQYGEFKKDLAEVIKNFLSDFQEKYNKITNKQVEKVFKQGADKLKPVAEEKILKVKKKIGAK